MKNPEERITLHLGRSPVVKATVTLPKLLADKFKEYAASQKLSFSEVVTQALKLDDFARKLLEDGHTIYVQKEPSATVVKMEIIRMNKHD
jgi:hypothetical protein